MVAYLVLKKDPEEIMLKRAEKLWVLPDEGDLEEISQQATIGERNGTVEFGEHLYHVRKIEGIKTSATIPAPFQMDEAKYQLFPISAIERCPMEQESRLALRNLRENCHI